MADTTHACPGGCGVQVQLRYFACPACWYALPYELRQPISRAYQRDPVAHLRAMQEARRWYRKRGDLSAAGLADG
jgi:hypothetical protein